MKYDIIFSVPVHESEDAILELAKNYHYFNPNCALVLHVSLKYGNIDRLSSKLPINTFINNQRIWSGRADGSQMLMHLMNYEYVLKKNISFEYFSLNASNEFFIRKGLLDYMRPYDSGFEISEVKDILKWKIPSIANRDSFLQKSLSKKLINKKLYSCIEGTYYKKYVMDYIYENCIDHARYDFQTPFKINYKKLYNHPYIYHILKRLFPTKYYVTEEVYPPSFAQKVAKSIGQPFCYFNTKHNMGFVTKNEIIAIVKQDMSMLPKYDRHALGRNFYSVKRVIRTQEDEIRNFIKQELMK